jgi:uncharacterized protein
VTLPPAPSRTPPFSPLRRPPFLLETPAGLVLNLRVQPGARRTSWAGIHGEQLKLMIQAQPVEDAANQGCLVFLAHWFGVKKSKVLLLKGGKSRSKRFLIKDLSMERALSLIPTQIESPPHQDAGNLPGKVKVNF